MRYRIAFILAALVVATTVAAEEPKELRDARRAYDSLEHPSEIQRVRYITQLVRLREKFTRADIETLSAIDAEVSKHPMLATADSRELSKRLIGRWQSPRRPYFYHADGTCAANDDTAEENTGTWHIKGNKFFQDHRDQPPDSGETIILLTSTDFIFGNYYLRRGKAFPWH